MWSPVEERGQSLGVGTCQGERTVIRCGHLSSREDGHKVWAPVKERGWSLGVKEGGLSCLEKGVGLEVVNQRRYGRPGIACKLYLEEGCIRVPLRRKDGLCPSNSRGAIFFITGRIVRIWSLGGPPL